MLACLYGAQGCRSLGAFVRRSLFVYFASDFFPDGVELVVESTKNMCSRCLLFLISSFCFFLWFGLFLFLSARCIAGARS
jgi:hypothetical protein